MFIEHFCLMKLPVSCYHYVQCDTTQHKVFKMYCIAFRVGTARMGLSCVHQVSACA